MFVLKFFSSIWKKGGLFGSSEEGNRILFVVSMERCKGVFDFN